MVTLPSMATTMVTANQNQGFHGTYHWWQQLPSMVSFVQWGPGFIFKQLSFLNSYWLIYKIMIIPLVESVKAWQWFLFQYVILGGQVEVILIWLQKKLTACFNSFVLLFCQYGCKGRLWTSGCPRLYQGQCCQVRGRRVVDLLWSSGLISRGW